MPAPRTRATPRRAGGTRAPAPPVPGTTVLFVRHGTTPTTGKELPGRARGLDLADKGRAQAEAAARRLAALPAGRRPAAVYASPLERAQQTAAPIAKALHKRVRTERGLVEVDVGAWTGASLKRLVKTPEWAAVHRWPGGFSFPRGESFAELTARSTATVVALCARHRGESIVVVSHADVIKAVVAAAAGVPIDLFQRLVVSPCSISAVHYGPAGPLVLCVNATDSLDELVPS